MDTITTSILLSPRRFELLQIPHQEIILPLNHRLSYLNILYDIKRVYV